MKHLNTKQKIASLEEEIADLKRLDVYLIDAIRTVYMEESYFGDESLGIKPGDLSYRGADPYNKMAAALAYAIGKCPRYSFDVKFRSAQSDNEEPIWFYSNDVYKVTIGVELSKLKQVFGKNSWYKKVTIEIWRDIVTANNTLQSYNEWFEKVTEERLLKYLQAAHGEKVHLVNEPELQIQDIVIMNNIA